MMIERDLYLTVVAMGPEDAKAFAMPGAAKVVYAGQADQTRYKFGARLYYLFETMADYNAWVQHARDGGAA